MNIGYRFRKIRHSALFQGGRLPKRYFEGWYFKLVSSDGTTFAIIPGVSITGSGQKTAFIQTIDGRTASTRYLEYDFDTFEYSKRGFSIRIGDSSFSSGGIELHHSGDGHELTGRIRFGPLSDIPRSVVMPGIMGWYRYVPMMECYHGVISTDHRIDGQLILDGERLAFNDGRGYIEKDWGRSFPSSWIWLQCNGFDTPGVSVMVSIAKIPWLGSSFVGFLGFVRLPDGFARFATYSRARITRLEVLEDRVVIELQSPDCVLALEVIKGKPGGLKAPAKGAMERIIAESVSATVQMRLSGRLDFEGIGTSGGLEIAGDTAELLSEANHKTAADTSGSSDAGADVANNNGDTKG